MLSIKPNCGAQSMIFMEYLRNPTNQNLNLVLQHIELPSNAGLLSRIWDKCNLDRKLFYQIGLVLSRLGRNCEAQYYLGFYADDNKDSFQSWIYLSDVVAKRHDLGNLDYCIKKLIDLKAPDTSISLELIKQNLICGRNGEALEIALVLSNQNVELRGMFILFDVIIRTNDQFLLAKLNRRNEFPICLENLSKRDNYQLLKLYKHLIMNILSNFIQSK